MAHLVDTMAYNVEEGVPWHGLGTPINGRVKSDEMIRLAGLDWSVRDVPATCTIDGELQQVPGRKVLYRGDNKMILADVSNGFEYVQNETAFAFCDDLVEVGDLLYETAGALDGGRKIFLLAKMPGTYTLGGEDIADRYLAFVNHHDSTGSLRCFLTTVRIVCDNTCRLAVSEADGGLMLRHTKSIHARLEQGKRIMGVADVQFRKFAEQAQFLKTRQFDPTLMRELAVDLVPPTVDETGKMSTRAINIHDKLVWLFENGRGQQQPGTSGTRWAALNAVTEWTSHLRSPNGSQEAKFTSLLMGSSAALTDKALKSLLVAA